VCVCVGGYNKLRNDPDSSDSPASSPGQNSEADDSDNDSSWPADRHQPISTIANSAIISSSIHTDFTTPKAVVAGGREPKSASSTDGESTLTKRSQERLTAPARFVRRALVKSYQQFMEEDAPSDDVSHVGILPLAAEETSLGLSIAAADRRDGGSEDSREASSEGEDEANDSGKTAFDYQSLYEDDDKSDSGALVGKYAGGEQQPRRLAERVKQQFEALSGGKLKSYQQDVPSRVAQMERHAALEALLGGEEMLAPGDSSVGEASSQSTVFGEEKSAFSAIGSNFRRGGDDHQHDNSNNRDDVFSLAPFAAAKYSKLPSSKSSTAGSECYDTQQALLSSPESVEAIFANAPFAKLMQMAPAPATTDTRKQDVFATYMNPLAVVADQADTAAREQSAAALSAAKHHTIDSEDRAQKLRSADNHGPSRFVVDWPATTSLTSLNSNVPTKLVTMNAAPTANNMPNNVPMDVQLGSGGSGLVVWGDGVFTAAPALNIASANSVAKMVNVMYSNPATSFSTSGGVQLGPSVPPVHTADHVMSSNPSVSQQHQNVGVTGHSSSKTATSALSAAGVQRSGNHQSLFTEDPNSPEGVRMSDDILVDADEPLLAKDKGSSSSVGLSKKLRQSPLDSSSSSASSMRLPSAVSPFGGGVTGPSPRGFIGRLTGGGGSGKVAGTVSPTTADDQSGGNSSSASSLSSPYGSLKRGKDKGVLGSGKKSQSVVDSQFANAGFMDDLALEREENFDSNALGNSYPLATRQGQAAASANVVTKDRSNSLPRSAKYTK
jgi:hypothetical protein